MHIQCTCNSYLSRFCKVCNTPCEHKVNNNYCCKHFNIILALKKSFVRVTCICALMCMTDVLPIYRSQSLANTAATLYIEPAVVNVQCTYIHTCVLTMFLYYSPVAPCCFNPSVTAAMTRSTIEDTYNLVHLPGKDGAPPIPPRTYSKRTPSANGHVGIYNNFVRPSLRKYTLEEFTFLKLLGKGSFGKVYTYTRKYMCMWYMH